MTKEQAIEVLHELDGSLYETQQVALDMAIKALEQQTNDCKIFGTKENCFGGATENECNYCDYKIQKLEQYPSDDCVNIAELEKWLDLNFSFGGACRKLELFERLEKELPRVTPTFPKGATNGDIILAAFPDYKVKHSSGQVILYYEHTEEYSGSWIKFDEEWWNAPYKRGSEE